MMQLIRYTFQGMIYRYFFSLLFCAMVWVAWVCGSLWLVKAEQDLGHDYPRAVVVFESGYATDSQAVGLLKANPMVHSFYELTDSDDVKAIKSRIALMSQEKQVWPEVFELRFIPGLKFHQLSHQINLIKTYVGVKDVLWDSDVLKSSLLYEKIRGVLLLVVTCVWTVVGMAVGILSFLRWQQAVRGITDCFRGMSVNMGGIRVLSWFFGVLFFFFYAFLGFISAALFL